MGSTIYQSSYDCLPTRNAKHFTDGNMFGKTPTVSFGRLPTAMFAGKKPMVKKYVWKKDNFLEVVTCVSLLKLPENQVMLFIHGKMPYILCCQMFKPSC